MNTRPAAPGAAVVAAAALVAALMLAGCGPVPDPRSAQGADLCPPQVQLVHALDATQIAVEFDEEASLVAGKTTIDPPLAVVGSSGPSKQVTIDADPQSPGRHYQLQASAADARGNVASFQADFWGFNARVPRLLINELTPRGSGNHPDLVELKVVTDGDMGGVVFYVGTQGNYQQRLVFPSFPIRKGAFILVHCRPTGNPAEVNETDNPSASGGQDASETAIDVWLPGGTGLPGNNGALTLYDRPGGAVLDAILYSNRTATSDELFRGFGSDQMLGWAEELVRQGAWTAAAQKVSPEDAVNPEGSTATRSLCRSSSSADTNTAADWHIVPTRASSFGSENSDEVYVPQAAANADGPKESPTPPRP